jgi:hypothetical protein
MTAYNVRLEEINAVYIPLDKPLSNNNTVILTIDRSGSMSGAPIKSVREGLNLIVPTLLEAGTTVWLVKYNTFASCELLTKENWERIVDISATGGTNFTSAFNCIIELINKISKGSDVIKICFMTDGEDQSKCDNINILKTLPTEIHVIGFGSCDVKFLLRVMNAGMHPGTFQASAGSTTKSDVEKVPLSVAIDNLSDQFSNSNLVVQINGINYTVNSQMVSTGYAAIIFLPKEKVNEVSIIALEDSSKDSSKDSSNIHNKKLELTEYSQNIIIDVTLAYIDNRLQFISKNIIGIDFSAAIAQVEHLREYINNTKEIIKKLTPRLKKLFTPTIVAYGQKLSDFLSILASKVTISNEIIANLNHLAFRDGLKRRDIKRLDERAIKNAPLFDSHEEKIEKIVISFANVDFKKYQSTYKIPKCFITLNSWKSLLRNGDCLCMCVEVAKSTSVVNSAFNIRILNIQPSMVSARTLLDAASNLLSTTDNAKLIHGGFTKEAGTVTVGVARESINGGIPLYINDIHWSISRLLMPQLFGWMATCDPLGYAYEQLRAIPIMALARSLQLSQSLHNTTTISLLLDICEKLFDEASASVSDFEKWTDEVVRLVNNYASVEVRTKDSIPNTEAFLITAWLAQRKGLINNIHDIFFDVWIEETRRSMDKSIVDEGNVNKLQEIKYIALDIDRIIIPKYVNNIVTNFKNSLNFDTTNDIIFKNLFLSVSSRLHSGAAISLQAKPEVKNDKVYMEKSSDFKKDFYDNPSEFVNLITIVGFPLDSVYERLLPLFKVLGGNLPTIDKVSSCAAFIQCFNGKSNEKYRDMISNGIYLDITKSALDIIFNEYDRIITDEISSRKSAILNDFNAKNNYADSSIFSRTDDLEVAAGVLLKSCYVGRNINSFAKSLNTESPHAYEKLRMLISGKYKSLILIRDILFIHGGLHYQKWVPSYLHRKKIGRKLNISPDDSIFTC